MLHRTRSPKMTTPTSHRPSLGRRDRHVDTSLVVISYGRLVSTTVMQSHRAVSPFLDQHEIGKIIHDSCLEHIPCLGVPYLALSILLLVECPMGDEKSKSILRLTLTFIVT
jgi:hypothetical protein